MLRRSDGESAHWHRAAHDLAQPGLRPQGRTAKVQVSAIDDQGNQISTSFDASNVGSGITVSRDETFQPVFVNDTTLQAPAEAATFQFNVNAVDLVNSSFELNAGGKNVTVPVTVTPDPANVRRPL